MCSHTTTFASYVGVGGGQRSNGDALESPLKLLSDPVSLISFFRYRGRLVTCGVGCAFAMHELCFDFCCFARPISVAHQDDEVAENSCASFLVLHFTRGLLHYRKFLQHCVSVGPTQPVVDDDLHGDFDSSKTLTRFWGTKE